jgi:hypothetical protein
MLMSSFCLPYYYSLPVYRVNWLKAKARYERWSEELKLVQHEMFWAISWFQKQEEKWALRALQSTQKGHQAYAEKQASMWLKFVAEGVKKFEGKMTKTG